MNILTLVNAAIVSLGFPTILAVAIYIGRKLQILDDLKGMRSRFDIVESRVGDLWADRLAPARSPRELNDQGQMILSKSGIKEIVDAKKIELLNLVKEKNAATAYDAEQLIMKIMQDFTKYYPETTTPLKNGSYQVGADLDAVLFVGGIYLRNLIFKDLGFGLSDLDQTTLPNSGE